MGTWASSPGGGQKENSTLAGEQQTHWGRPFQSAYSGWSVPTKKCGYFEVNLSLSLSLSLSLHLRLSYPFLGFEHSILHANRHLQVTEDIEELRLNTGISAMMEFVNGAIKWESVPRPALEAFSLLLSPFAPHIAEELWQVWPDSYQMSTWGWGGGGGVKGQEDSP